MRESMRSLRRHAIAPDESFRESLWQLVEREFASPSPAAAPVTALGRPHRRRTYLAAAAAAVLLAAVLPASRVISHDSSGELLIGTEPSPTPTTSALVTEKAPTGPTRSSVAVSKGPRVAPPAGAAVLPPQPAPAFGQISSLASKQAAGPTLVYTFRDGQHYDLMVRTPDGTRRSLSHDNAYHPDYSPDGLRLAWTKALPGPAQILISDAAGRHVRQLTHVSCSAATPYTECGAQFPDWSPDGRVIAYTVGTQHSGCLAEGDCAQIWTMRSDGSAQRQLTTGWQPDWSPDGTELLVVDNAGDSNRASCDATITQTCDGTLFVVNRDGARRSLGITGSYPRWSPDGRSISFQRFDPVDYFNHVYVADADGSDARVVLTRSEYASWTPSGRLLTLHLTDNWHIFTCDVAGVRLAQLTNRADDQQIRWPKLRPVGRPRSSP